MKINSITYGSNFGYESHLKSLKKFHRVKKSFIYSPNIRNKTNINKKTNITFFSFNIILLSIEVFYMINY